MNEQQNWDIVRMEAQITIALLPDGRILEKLSKSCRKNTQLSPCRFFVTLFFIQLRK